MNKTITANSDILLHFDIRLKDGSIADSTHHIGQAMPLTLGKQVFSDTFEQALIGLKAGDKKKIMLMPEEAFGEAHPANIYQMPKSRLDNVESDEPLDIGSIIQFNQPNGQIMPGIIRGIDDHEVTIDFNHPLAGQIVLFDVEIIAVQS